MVNPRDCRHENIYWEDFFKEEKQNNNNYRHKNAYCVDCGAEKGKSFAFKVQTWYCKRIKEWLAEKGLIEKKSIGNTDYYFDSNFTEFLKKNNYDQYWNDLNRGKVDKDFEGLGDGLLGQDVFFEVARGIESFCLEFEKEKPNDPPHDRERERERERESKTSTQD